MSRKIEKLLPFQRVIYDQDVAKKIDELIDAVNEMREPAVGTDPYAPHQCRGLEEWGKAIIYKQREARWYLRRVAGNQPRNINLLGDMIHCPCCDWVPPGGES